MVSADCLCFLSVTDRVTVRQTLFTGVRVRESSRKRICKRERGREKD
jgi:hypothetical protein